MCEEKNYEAKSIKLSQLIQMIKQPIQIKIEEL